ncbi:hypothetical protein [Micromonospora sp. ATCC 39149]|uniref:Uncharacterized protein n=1 Tax=Micromonospora carbonacea TaxID=47853 RepID=A0A7D5Y8A9_9ACTN|nr:hypothetical protein [Micromonospora sp. ATCC 39149]QLJ97280.1 hypothetical protein HZU44_20915 [Micromonospora carbonacea]
MLIDCDRCRVRGAGCGGCLVTALLDTEAPEGGLGPAELRAIEVFARAGFDVEVLTAAEAAPGGDAPEAPARMPRPRPTRRRRAA